MRKLILAIFFGLGFAASAQAIDSSGAVSVGEVTIHNNNCSPWLQDHVRVHFWGQASTNEACTDTWVSLKHGETKTFQLRREFTDSSSDGKTVIHTRCKYFHEAEGTTGGKQDLYGDEVASVTCKNDWAGVCQCTKD